MEIILNNTNGQVTINGEIIPNIAQELHNVVNKFLGQSKIKSFEHYNFRNLISISTIDNKTTYRFILDGGIKWLNLSDKFMKRFQSNSNNAKLHSKPMNEIFEYVDAVRKNSGGLLKTHQPDFLADVVVIDNKIETISGGIILLNDYGSYDKSLKIFKQIPNYFEIYAVPSHTFGGGKLCTPLPEISIETKDIYRLTHQTVWQSEYSTDLFSAIESIGIFTYYSNLVAEGEMSMSDYYSAIRANYHSMKV